MWVRQRGAGRGGLSRLSRLARLSALNRLSRWSTLGLFALRLCALRLSRWSTLRLSVLHLIHLLDRPNSRDGLSRCRRSSRNSDRSGHRYRHRHRHRRRNVRACRAPRGRDEDVVVVVHDWLAGRRGRHDAGSPGAVDGAGAVAIGVAIGVAVTVDLANATSRLLRGKGRRHSLQ